MNGHTQMTTQAVVVSADSLEPNPLAERIALFDESGDPISLTSAEVPTGADILLTDYEIGEADPISDTDSVNEAIGKLEAQVGVPTGADILLTDYEIGTAGAVADTDSLNEAIAKLEARILELETP